MSSKKAKNCAFCDSCKVIPFMDFGKMALAGGFLKKEDFHKETKFNMRMGFCEQCFAVQIIDKISPDLLFKDYFYFSSTIKTLQNHFNEYAKEIASRFLNSENASVLEIGCNDGILLKPLAENNIKTIIGVDPALNVISTINDNRIKTICNYFNENVAENVIENYGKIDLVTANNAYAHIDDIQGTTRAIKKVLSDDGVFVFEVHYLGNIIDGLQYDMVYHEHIYYYSLLSAINHFKKYDMTVFDIEPKKIHGGSYRFYVCNNHGKHANQISKNVNELIKIEKGKGYNILDTYKDFSNNVHKIKNELMDLIINLKSKGKRIAGYGASGRANTMIQFCELTKDHIDYMIDDSPSKLGYFTPGSHFEIKSNSILYDDNPPDYVIIFAWTFFDEIRSKNLNYLKSGGKFIVPLPSVSIQSI